jgi:glycosyltransferase involved in cell wall biosynthesis
MMLSLVIPCYNEAENLPSLIARCRELVRHPDIECILVDNGSTDGSASVLSAQLAGQTQLRMVKVEQNKGYGHGILAGLKQAQGRILAWTHADLQTDPTDVLRGLECFKKSKSPDRLFVKGQRFGRPASDVVFTVGMSIFETALLAQPLWDINAQPTMFPRSFFERWKTPPDDFALDLYVYYNARQAGMTVERFPVHFSKRLHGHSHWNVNWQAKVKFIRRTLKYSFRLRREMKAL